MSSRRSSRTSVLARYDSGIAMTPQDGPLHLNTTTTARKTRPVSAVTDLYDTDIDDEEYQSEEDLYNASPRASINSAGQQSLQTLESVDELQTPLDAEAIHFRAFKQGDAVKQRAVKGPVGPHLFRSSIDSSLDTHEAEYVLSMSPMTPKVAEIQTTAFDAPAVPPIPMEHRDGDMPIYLDANLHFDQLNLNQLAAWTPRQVAQWISSAGFEAGVVEKFEENDISGAILMTLKFEDLRELDIPSFGKRTQLWNEIHVMRGSAPNTPAAETPIEGAMWGSCSPTRAPRRHEEQLVLSSQDPSRTRSRRRRRPDNIEPGESVSIIGIEQLMPKPHQCYKGENCSKYRKQQRLIDTFMREHPHAVAGGIVEIDTYGDRPFSAATASIVASSDVLGPAQLPSIQSLQEAHLQDIPVSDRQAAVKQFIQFQHVATPQYWGQQDAHASSQPYEMFPPMRQNSHAGVGSLPRLSIPVPPPRSKSTNTMSPGLSAHHQAGPWVNGNINTTPALRRFGTPASEMDVPVTAVPLGPVARDMSQSVPPNMNYYHHQPVASNDPIMRSNSRTSHRRPSIQLQSTLPPLHEHLPMKSVHRRRGSSVSQSSVGQPQHRDREYRPSTSDRPDDILRTPTNHYSENNPWSNHGEGGTAQRLAQDATSTRHPMQSSHASPERTPAGPAARRSSDDSSRDLMSTTSSSTPPKDASNATTMSGWMKKRRTRMLRHEWQDRHFVLRGTRLAMHADARALSELDYIDIDDYAVACSSLASGSKLNAAFKAMSLMGGNHDHGGGYGGGHGGGGGSGNGSGKRDEAAFAFQLVPALDGKNASSSGGAKEGVRRVWKEMSNSLGVAGGGGSSGDGGGASKGKTHYFAVRNREERIDWMRELMLAKALKQRSDGYRVTVNGQAA